MFENCFFSHHLFPVFYNSGFKRTLCGGQWQSSPGGDNYLTSTGRLGCCSPGTFMNSSTSTVCDACPSGQYGSTVQNDDTSCCALVPNGICSTCTTAVASGCTAISSCDTGYDNLDNDATNGCETAVAAPCIFIPRL